MGRYLLATVLLSALAAAPSAAYQVPSGAADLASILECMKQDGNFTMFLKLFRDTGFAPIIARYINSQPITILAPTDDAIKKLPKAMLRREMSGSKLVKLFETLMLEHKLPLAYLQLCQPHSFFDTVYGTYIYKQPSADGDTVLLSMTPEADPADMAVITHPDLCHMARPTCAVHGISTVLIPPQVFETVSLMPKDQPGSGSNDQAADTTESQSL